METGPDGCRRAAQISTLPLGIIMVFDLYMAKKIPREAIVDVMTAVTETIEATDCKGNLCSIFEVLRNWQEGSAGNRKLQDSFLKLVCFISSPECIDRYFDYMLDMLMFPPHAEDKSTGCAHAKSLIGKYILHEYERYSQMDFDEQSILWDEFVCCKKKLLSDANEQEEEEKQRGRPSTTLSKVDFESYLEEVLAKSPPIRSCLNEKEKEPEVFLYKDCGLDVPVTLESIHREHDGTSRYGYQWALVRKMMMHAVLNHFEYALKNAKEAITVARANKDTMCIAAVVLWLCWLHCTHPNVEISESFGEPAQLFRYLVNIDLKNHPLIQAMIPEFDTDIKLEAGVPPQVIVQTITRYALQYADLAKDWNLLITHHTICAKVWDWYGKGWLSQQHQLMIEEIIDDQSAEERCICTEGWYLALYQGLHLGKLRTAKARIENALNAKGPRLSNRLVAESFFQKPLPKSVDFLQCEQVRRLLDISFLLNQLQLPAARAAIESLRATGPMVVSISEETNLTELRLLLAEGRYALAFDKAISWYESSASKGSMSESKLAYLLFGARALACSDSVASFLEALDITDQCYDEACRVCNVPYALQAQFVKIKVLLSLKRYNEAQTLCEKFLPKVFPCLDPYLASEACDIYATCVLEQYYRKAVDSEAVQRAFGRAQEALKFYEDCDIVALDLKVLSLKQEAMRELSMPLILSYEDVEAVEMQLNKLKKKSLIRHPSTQLDDSSCSDKKRRQALAQRRPSKKHRRQDTLQTTEPGGAIPGENGWQS